MRDRDLQLDLRVPAALAYAIAARIRQLPALGPLDTLQIAYWTDVGSPVAEHLQRALGLDRKSVELTNEQIDLSSESLSPFSRSRRVVLVIDQMWTGRTAGRMARYVWRMGAVPVCIVSLIDNRLARGPINAFNGDVPVTSLSIGTVGPKSLPSARSARPPSHSSDDHSFEPWLVDGEQSALYVGHIVRGFSRHFSTYLNITDIVNGERNSAVNLLVQDIIHRVPLQTVGRRLVLVFPDRPDQFAAKLSDSVADRLRTLGCECELFPIDTSQPVSDVARQWQSGTVAVIVDWGAVTTATVRQLMRVAAQLGADQIHASVLTSQLSGSAEDQLSEISSIRVHRASDGGKNVGGLFIDGPTGETSVAISAKFLMRVPMGMSNGRECFLCSAAHQYLKHESDAPTHVLRQHAGYRWTRFRPWSVAEATVAGPHDIFGQPLDADSGAAVWIMRQRLSDRVASVGSDLYIEEILGISKETEHSNALASEESSRRSRQVLALLRLLAVEPHWLHRWPLDTAGIRTGLANWCLKVLSGGPEGLTTSGSLLLHCVWGLRAADKRYFVDRFGQLLALYMSDELVSGELCYSMYLLLDRRYHRYRRPLVAIATGLLDARERLLERRKSSDSNLDPLLHTVNFLHRRVLEIQGRIEGDVPALVAWHALQAKYTPIMNTHASSQAAMLTVQSAFSGDAASRTAAAGPANDGRRDSNFWMIVAECWDECLDFLAQNVFPYMPALKGILETVGSRDAINVYEDLLVFNSYRGEKFGYDLRSLARDPDSFGEGMRSRLEEEAQSWLSLFFRAPQPSSSEQGPTINGSALLQLLSANPANVAVVWEDAVRWAELTRLRLGGVEFASAGSVNVFCSRNLLLRIYQQILRNACGSKHASASRPAEGPQLALSVNREGGRVIISVVNDWANVREPDSGGLTFLEPELASYGGSIEQRGVIIPGSGIPGWQVQVELYSFDEETR